MADLGRFARTKDRFHSIVVVVEAATAVAAALFIAV